MCGKETSHGILRPGREAGEMPGGVQEAACPPQKYSITEVTRSQGKSKENFLPIASCFANALEPKAEIEERFLLAEGARRRRSSRCAPREERGRRNDCFLKEQTDALKTKSLDTPEKSKEKSRAWPPVNFSRGADVHHLAGLDGQKRLGTGGHERQQILDAIGFGAQDHNADAAPCRFLLILTR